MLPHAANISAERIAKNDSACSPAEGTDPSSFLTLVAALRPSFWPPSLKTSDDCHKPIFRSTVTKAILRRLITAIVIPVAACARVTAPVSSLPASHAASTVVDRSAAPCTVSYDGVIWYRIPAREFPPIDVRFATCGFKVLGRNLSPHRPHWSIPSAATQTRFVFTSLDEVISVKGTRNIERMAAAHHVPVSWMVGDIRHMAYAADYNAFHRTNGDDAQAQFWANLHVAMSAKLPWYVPSVSILTAGVERDVRRALSFGEHAFWGITWNSHGTDGTFDYGAPWGTYCADVHSYKRPQPDGGCAFLAFEWTARDLTRAYLSGREAAFSTDPTICCGAVDFLRRALPRTREELSMHMLRLARLSRLS